MHMYDEEESKGWRDFWLLTPDQKKSGPRVCPLGIKVLLSENVPKDTIVVGENFFKILSGRTT